MPDHRLRESILSLVTTPARAASIVGDLVESNHGPFRSWAAIASHLLHAVTPGAIKFALAGFLAQFLLSFLPPLLISQLPMDSYDWRRWCIVLAFTATQILTGCWIASRAPHRALFVTLLVALLDCAAGACSVNNGSVNMAIWSLPLLVGSFLYRRTIRRHA